MAGGFRQTYIDVVQLPQPTWQPCFLRARRMANAIQVVKLLLLQQICNRLFVFLESLNIGVAVDVRFDYFDRLGVNPGSKAKVTTG